MNTPELVLTSLIATKLFLFGLFICWPHYVAWLKRGAE